MVKVYAAFRSGCLGDNILDAFFPFFANIICSENWENVEDTLVRSEFESKYKIPVPLTFVRQVLGVGVKNGSIIYSRGKYAVQKDKISQFQFDSEPFEKKWEQMISEFIKYCQDQGLDLSSYDIDARILDSIEMQDENIVLNEEFNATENADSFDYAWSGFLTEVATSSPGLFDFIVAISASNIIKQAVFFSGDGRDTFRGLNVYLDSPLIFALLGMDSPARTESCNYLLQKMQDAGCFVQLFDHNFSEISGILTRAGSWATSVDYRIDKANNAARFFHDRQMDEQDIAEFCESVEDKLNEHGITIKNTSYDVYEDTFQEDESQLYKMIEEKYHEYRMSINEDNKNSILVDVRSIIMVYRERRGQTATRIQSSRDILLTLNSVIANVSKQFESNQSSNSGHIPACISADIFGAVLWLFSPVELMEYQKKQLLADCYLSLRPNKRLLRKYVESLERARSSGDIDEKQFLFMRSHSVVNDALMNITKGDYARFNDRTYLEVFEEIKSISERKYEMEAAAHIRTQEALLELKEKQAVQAEQYKREMSETDNQISLLTETVRELKSKLVQNEEEEFNKKSRRLGWALTILIFGTPYIAAMVVIELLKSIYTQISFYSSIRVGVLIILTVFAGFLFQKGKQWCFLRAVKHLGAKRSKERLGNSHLTKSRSSKQSARM